ncbi:MAG: site-2 protease family protein [Candidatus Babeliales bacterium]
MVFVSYFTNLVGTLFFIVIAILGIGFLIGFHEFGHFIFCKIFKIKTPSFSIGMGPRIFKKKFGDTEFALSAIPLGGYVEIAGTEDDQEPIKDKQYSFAQKPYYQKMLVIAGGIIFNILFAYVALSALYFTGMPKSPLIYPLHATTKIKSIEKESPAAQSNLQEGDIILTIDKVNVQNKLLELMMFLKNNANQSVTATIKRNKEIIPLEIKIGERKIQNQIFGYLGIDFDIEIPQYNFFESIKMGIHATHTIIKQVFSIFTSMFRQRTIENLGGPLMVISQTIKGAQQGPKILFLLLAFISINLAVLNVIPIPIMDGGQALFYTIEAIIRRPLPEQVKIYIHYACWLAVMALAVFLSIKDIMRMFMS